MEIWACGHLGPLFLPLFVPFNVQRLLICLLLFVGMVHHLLAKVFLYPCDLFSPLFLSFEILYMCLSGCLCFVMIKFNLLGSGFLLLPAVCFI